MQTVNANACEFLEILLRTMSGDKELTQEVTHLLINRLVKTLHLAIENDNTALQLQLLQLIKVILLKCHFYTAELKTKVEKGNENDRGYY